MSRSALNFDVRQTLCIIFFAATDMYNKTIKIPYKFVGNLREFEKILRKILNETLKILLKITEKNCKKIGSKFEKNMREI